MSDGIETLTDIVAELLDDKATAETIATSVLTEIQADPLAYVKVKPLEWRWIGTTRAFCGGCEVLLTKFTAPEDRKMWRLRLSDEPVSQWFEDGELELAQAAAQAHCNEMVRGMLENG